MSEGGASYKYLAFISYKREDEKWAKWLQYKLEHYKLPISVRKDNPTLPERVRPVFKDTTDLAGGVLEKVIKEALCASKYLIVICSPRAAQSPWVCKEVQEFIALGRENCIIPFIIDGEPYSDDDGKECYPESLRALMDDKELLGININENGRDAAAVKVVARMFDVRFDVLWQRFQRQAKKQRRMILICLIVIIVLVVDVALWISMQSRIIKRQNVELELKNENIQNVNKALERANDSIRTAYNRLDISEKELEKSNDQLRESNIRLAEERDIVLRVNRKIRLANAKILSDNAETSLNTGNFLKSIGMLKQISSDELVLDMMDIPEVEFAFRHIYREVTRDGFKQRFNIDNIGDVSFAEFDETGENIFLCINDSELVKVNATSGQLDRIGDISRLDDDSEIYAYAFDYAKGDLYHSMDNLLCISNIYSNDIISRTMTVSNEIDDVIVSPRYDYLLYCTEDEWYLVDLNCDQFAGEIIPDCKDVYSISSDGTKILANINDEYCIYSVANKLVESIAPCNSNPEVFVESYFTEDDTNVVISSYDYSTDERECDVVIYNIVLGEFVQMYDKINSPTIWKTAINPLNNRLIIGHRNGDLSVYNLDMLSYYPIRKVMCDDIKVSRKIEEIYDTNYREIRFINFNKNGTKMLVVSDSKMSVWDVRVDDVLQKNKQRFEFVSRSGKSYIKTVDGYAQLYDMNNNEPVGIPLFEDANSRFWVKIVSGDNKFVVALRESFIYVINLESNSYFKIPYTGYISSSNLSMDKNGGRLVVLDRGSWSKQVLQTLSIYDLNNVSIISQKYLTQHFITKIAISPNGEEVVMVNSSKIMVYDAETLNEKIQLKNDQGFIKCISYSPNGEYIIASTANRTICIWNAFDGTLIKTLVGAEYELEYCSISTDGKYLIASSSSIYNKNVDIGFSRNLSYHAHYVWNIDSGEIIDRFDSEFPYSFCDECDNKIYSHFDICDYPSKEELVDFINNYNSL